MKTFYTEHDVETELLSYAPGQLYSGDIGLGRIILLAKHLENPQDKLKVVHIAGTSGKTSTSYYVRALLEASGQKTGLTISPHIDTIRERVQIGGKPISEERFVQYFNEFYPLVYGFEPRPTFFELVTIFAYWVFAQEKVDYAVVETGLGGRLDATNIVSRGDKVCIITPIGYDHTAILGNSLTEIAAEKAGIIQFNNKVFISSQDKIVLGIVSDRAKEKKSDLEIVAIDDINILDAKVPDFQRRNFMLATKVVEYISSRDGFAMVGDLSGVISSTQVPGRWEVYRVGDKTIMLDGAHNPQKLETFFSALDSSEFSGMSRAAVVSLSEAPDEKIVDCVEVLSKNISKVIFTSFTIQSDVPRRSVELERMVSLSDSKGLMIEADAQKALKDALSGHEELVIVTGSLYLVAVLRPIVRSIASK